ncbi:unnamed protein product [Rotaria socialis]
MLMPKQVEFNVPSIVSRILYPPYSFLFGASDKVLENATNSNDEDYVPETAATHALLAVHMLFVSILMLNLLIAVFGFTIQNVHENTLFHWQYQRYLIVREYFTKPLFSYPPLNILSIIWLMLTYIFHKLLQKVNCYRCIKNSGRGWQKTKRIFKIIPKQAELMNHRWNSFEHIITKGYAKSVVDSGFVVKSSPTIDTIRDDI